jgi:hypothetical protein
MKKYNSVYTVAISIDHDEEDASDVTQEMLIAHLSHILDLCSSIPVTDMIFDGPDNTIENE